MKPSHSAGTNTCLLFIYPHREQFPSRIWIISRCPIDRMQVASDSAIDVSRFWSALLNLFWYDNSNGSLGCLKIVRFKRDQTNPRFSPGFYTFLVSFQVETLVFLIYNRFRLHSSLHAIHDILILLVSWRGRVFCYPCASWGRFRKHRRKANRWFLFFPFR